MDSMNKFSFHEEETKMEETKTIDGIEITWKSEIIVEKLPVFWFSEKWKVSNYLHSYKNDNVFEEEFENKKQI